MAYFRMGPMRAYFVNNPQLIREVLVTKHKSFRRPDAGSRGRCRRSTATAWCSATANFGCASGGWCSRPSAPSASTATPQVTVDYTRRMLDRWSGGDVVRHRRRDDPPDAATSSPRRCSTSSWATARPSWARRCASISETFVREAGNPFNLPDWLPTAEQAPQALGHRDARRA